MKATTAGSISNEIGPRARRVHEFVETQRRIREAGVSGASDWDALDAFVSVDTFKRVGAYLEELDWRQYKAFLTGWIDGGTRFEMTEFAISEIGDTVFQEIEERHYRGNEFIRKNVIAVYRFDDRGRIAHLDIYEQARDSGRWIAESAAAAMAQH